MSDPPEVDVVVVTALQLERQAVRSHLANVRVETMSGLAADIGEFTDFRSQTVAIVETGAGNIEASALTTRAEEMFRPQIVAMVGIAGGLKDVDVGDVVASSKIYWMEGGRQGDELAPRPDFAAVSTSLVQLARAVAAEGKWLQRATASGGVWSETGSNPRALVAPIVSGEKVLASKGSSAIELIRNVYGDALAVDMEDFGALRGGHSAERVRAIAIRGVSDLIDKKEMTEVKGSQPLAAANAAAFFFELLSLDRAGDSTRVLITPHDLAPVASQLYPGGPSQDGIWQRAGGDPSRLLAAGSGFAQWWHAAVLLDQGGGGSAITMHSLVATMTRDYPNNEDLMKLFNSS